MTCIEMTGRGQESYWKPKLLPGDLKKHLINLKKEDRGDFKDFACIFVCDKRTPISMDLMVTLRMVQAIPPSDNLILQSLLMSNGFSHCEALAQKLLQLRKKLPVTALTLSFSLGLLKSIILLAAQKLQLPTSPEGNVTTLYSICCYESHKKCLDSSLENFEDIMHESIVTLMKSKLYPRMTRTISSNPWSLECLEVQEQCLLTAAFNILKPVVLRTPDLELALVETFPVAHSPTFPSDKVLGSELGKVLKETGLHPSPGLVSKMTDLHSTLLCHPVVILRGSPDCGKTACLHTLAQTLNRLSTYSSPVHISTFYLPLKSTDLDDILSNPRFLPSSRTSVRWLVFNGLPSELELLSLVHLPNVKVICELHPTMAPPTHQIGAAILDMEEEGLSWRQLADGWSYQVTRCGPLSLSQTDLVLDWLDVVVDPVTEFLQPLCPNLPNCLVATFLPLFTATLGHLGFNRRCEYGSTLKKFRKYAVKETKICMWVGRERGQFERFVRPQLGNCLPPLPLPPEGAGSLYLYYLHPLEACWALAFDSPPPVSRFLDLDFMLCPQSAAVLKLVELVHRHCTPSTQMALVGAPGVGKSALLRYLCGHHVVPLPSGLPQSHLAAMLESAALHPPTVLGLDGWPLSSQPELRWFTKEGVMWVSNMAVYVDNIPVIMAATAVPVASNVVMVCLEPPTAETLVRRFAPALEERLRVSSSVAESQATNVYLTLLLLEILLLASTREEAHWVQALVRSTEAVYRTLSQCEVHHIYQILRGLQLLSEVTSPFLVAQLWLHECRSTLHFCDPEALECCLQEVAERQLWGKLVSLEEDLSKILPKLVSLLEDSLPSRFVPSMAGSRGFFTYEPMDPEDRDQLLKNILLQMSDSFSPGQLCPTLGQWVCQLARLLRVPSCHAVLVSPPGCEPNVTSMVQLSSRLAGAAYLNLTLPSPDLLVPPPPLPSPPDQTSPTKTSRKTWRKKRATRKSPKRTATIEDKAGGTPLMEKLEKSFSDLSTDSNLLQKAVYRAGLGGGPVVLYLEVQSDSPQLDWLESLVVHGAGALAWLASQSQQQALHSLTGPPALSGPRLFHRVAANLSVVLHVSSHMIESLRSSHPGFFSGSSCHLTVPHWSTEDWAAVLVDMMLQGGMWVQDKEGPYEDLPTLMPGWNLPYLLSRVHAVVVRSGGIGPPGTPLLERLLHWCRHFYHHLSHNYQPRGHLEPIPAVTEDDSLYYFLPLYACFFSDFEDIFRLVQGLCTAAREP
ncbi:DNAH2 [Cordylochernes scorpioides]|uniref:DNAH2 n=1 Tax=Cordylochernes scorpioides TaxID=51811 RepID=A0ABY6LN81_9ARAC|nr:DNAH2 [Cordylochernes scorpioides]